MPKRRKKTFFELTYRIDDPLILVDPQNKKKRKSLRRKKRK